MKSVAALLDPTWSKWWPICSSARCTSAARRSPGRATARRPAAPASAATPARAGTWASMPIASARCAELRRCRRASTSGSSSSSNCARSRTAWISGSRDAVVTPGAEVNTPADLAAVEALLAAQRLAQRARREHPDPVLIRPDSSRRGPSNALLAMHRGRRRPDHVRLLRCRWCRRVLVAALGNRRRRRGGLEAAHRRLGVR